MADSKDNIERGIKVMRDLSSHNFALREAKENYLKETGWTRRWTPYFLKDTWWNEVRYTINGELKEHAIMLAIDDAVDFQSILDFHNSTFNEIEE